VASLRISSAPSDGTLVELTLPLILLTGVPGVVSRPLLGTAGHAAGGRMAVEHLLALKGSPILHKVQTVLTQWELHGINATWPIVWKGVPLVTLLVYVPSLLATILIMRIPYVRRIAG